MLLLDARGIFVASAQRGGIPTVKGGYRFLKGGVSKSDTGVCFYDAILRMTLVSALFLNTSAWQQ